MISLKVQKSPKTYYKSPQKNSRLHTKLKFLLRLPLYTEISNDFTEKLSDFTESSKVSKIIIKVIRKWRKVSQLKRNGSFFIETTTLHRNIQKFPQKNLIMSLRVRKIPQTYWKSPQKDEKSPYWDKTARFLLRLQVYTQILKVAIEKLVISPQTY